VVWRERALPCFWRPVRNETRQRIRELAEEVREKTEDYVDQAKGKVSQTIEREKDTFRKKSPL